MAAVFLIILFILVVFDAKLLQKKDAALYDKIFNAPAERWGFYVSFLFVVMLPIYMLRRQKFRESMPDFKRILDPEREAVKEEIASDACGLILLWFCVELYSLIVLYALSSWVPVFSSELSKMILISAVSTGLIVFLIYRITQRYTGGFLKNVALKPEYEGTSVLRLGLIPFLFGLGFAFFAVYVLENRAVQPETPLNNLVSTTDSFLPILMFAGVAILLAPVVEEIIFRGYFFNVIRRFRGENAAIVLISLTFAVLHYGQYWGDWMAIALITFLGFALTVIRSWSGSTIASIIMHYTYNFFVTVIPIVTLMVSNPAFTQYTVQYGQLDSQTKEELLQKSIQTNPNFTEAYNDLAFLYVQENRNLSEGLVLIERALEREPQNAAYLDTKATILYQLGRKEDAIAIASELVEKYPARSIFKERLNEFKKPVLERNF